MLKWIFLVVILGGGLILLLRAAPSKCAVKTEDYEVRGTSLQATLPQESEVELKRGWYACNDPVRNEIAAYTAPGYADPVIKVVRGVPGDRFGLIRDGAVANISINGSVLTNAVGAPYVISENRYNFLKLSVEQYNGVIPPNYYFLLGDVPSGSVDSILFGLIPRDQLIGRIVY